MSVCFSMREIPSFEQVNCKDRRGLLSDVIMALKSYPLEVCDFVQRRFAEIQCHAM